MRFHLLLLLILQFGYTNLVAQKSDPVLFTVGNQSVHQSEFDYIYSKNNGKNADYSKASVEEYLDLYIKFKLKVQRAREMRLDTITELKKELAGYRQQLANSYLVDKEVTQRLVDEAYERKKQDVRVKHILFSVPERSSAAAEANAMQRAAQAKEKLVQGADFDMMARTLSNDRTTGANAGDLGWLSAMLPSGFYDLETAIYNTEVGSYADPVKSSLGYHILSVTDKRPARGEMEVSHILIREMKKGKAVRGAKGKADSLYQILVKDPNKFESFVAIHSDDVNTSKKKGYLGFFGISQFELPFENAAFAIPDDGQITGPIKTSIGYHIIKRISKKNYSNQQKLKAELQADLKNNDRAENAKKSLIAQIKRDGDFKEYSLELSAFSNKLSPDFYTYKWEIPQLNDNAIASFAGKKILTKEFAEYCKKNTRTRLRFSKTMPLADAARQLFKTFSDEKAIQFEEANLEARYPEFKSLMREYEEGILLFEATKINVWDKASQDKEGLIKFHNKQRRDYKWNPRGVVDIYTLKSMDDKMIGQVLNLIQNKSAKEVLQLINTQQKILLHEEHTQEVGSKEFIGLEWKENAVSSAAKDPKNNITTLKKLRKILPASEKTLDDARGYIIADYQDQLESQWVKELRKAYKVDIKKKVLKSLIKK